MSEPKKVDGASPRSYVLIALGLSVALSLLFRPWQEAPPLGMSYFWANAAGEAIAMALRAVVIGGGVWTAIWFLFLRRTTKPAGWRTGWSVIGVAFAISMLGWAIGVGIASSPTNPKTVSLNAEQLGLAHRIGLAYDAENFEKELAGGRLVADAMASRVDQVIRKVMQSGDLDSAKVEVEAVRAVVEKHHKISRARYRQIREEVDALKGDRQTAVAAYHRSFGENTAVFAQAYWVDNEDMLDAASRAIGALRAGQGGWRPTASGGLAFNDRGTLAAWNRAISDINGAGKRLRDDALILRNPQAISIGSSTPAARDAS